MYTPSKCIHLQIIILKPSRYLKSIPRQVSVSTFQGEFKFHSLKDMQGYFFLLFWCLCFLYLFIHTYTPSNQHFKTFPVSKINSETSFLYQLFKENSSFIVLKPCKVIYLSIFFYFYFCFYYYLCIYLGMYAPSNHHFKAFLVSKINSKTSFLYHHFKENSNFVVLKMKVSIFYYFYFD